MATTRKLDLPDGGKDLEKCIEFLRNFQDIKYSEQLVRNKSYFEQIIFL
jgi:hypothetical protein